MKHFKYLGHEVLVFHILDNNEIELNLNNKTRFIDLETTETIITDPQLIKSQYMKKL